MNTKPITVTKEQKEKLKKAGVLVESETKLPAHLDAIFLAREAKFNMYEVTVDLDKYDDFHPIHAML